MDCLPQLDGTKPLLYRSCVLGTIRGFPFAPGEFQPNCTATTATGKLTFGGSAVRLPFLPHCIPPTIFRLPKGEPAMPYRIGVLAALLGGLVLAAAQAESPPSMAAICTAGRPQANELLAAKEIRRYVYLRTGKLLPIVELPDGFGDWKAAPPGGLIAVGGAGRFGAIAESNPDLARLAADQYVLRTIQHGGRSIVVVCGSGEGLIYAAYRFAEHLGVRFYLHGDVVPDKQIALELPNAGRNPQAAVRPSAAFSRSTIFPRGPTGGTATATRRSSASCRRWA